MDYRNIFRISSLLIWTGAVCFIAVSAALALTHHPQPALAQENALATLGRKMFSDPHLSADGQTSCSSCHDPAHAFSDGRMVSRGAFGRLGTRNTPSLLTVASESTLFWDGRRQRLEEAVLDPFEHPLELALIDDAALQSRLQTQGYREAFARAFGRADADTPTREQVGLALATFVRSLPKPETALDRYQAGDRSALSRQAIDGLHLFTGKAGCASCHQLEGSPSRFSDGKFHATGTGLQTIAERLPQLSAEVAQQSTDATFIGRAVSTHADWAAMGRFVVTHEAGDMGLFRTPSLRYVADTAPYMHDGSVPTLEGAVDQEIYWRGLTTGKPLSLTVSERTDLIAFLRALSPIKRTTLVPKSANAKTS